LNEAGAANVRIRWRRLLINPTTRIESREGEVTVLRVEGLVCDTVCAVRTREALEALPGVRSVQVDYDTGTARIEGGAQDAAAYERAVTGAVAGKPLRRAIEHLAQVFTRDGSASRKARMSR
jgi:mercuric reductase